MRRLRWVGVAAIVMAAAALVYLNAGERVSLQLGFVRLYRMSLTGLLFVSFLAGMVTMFLIGLGYDLKVRRALREADRRVARAKGTVIQPKAVEDSPPAQQTGSGMDAGDDSATQPTERDGVLGVDRRPAADPPHNQRPGTELRQNAPGADPPSAQRPGAAPPQIQRPASDHLSSAETEPPPA